MTKVTYLKYKYYFPKIQQIIALLAQSVARMTLNHKVRGSSPLQGYLFFSFFGNIYYLIKLCKNSLRNVA